MKLSLIFSALTVVLLAATTASAHAPGAPMFAPAAPPPMPPPPVHVPVAVVTPSTNYLQTINLMQRLHTMNQIRANAAAHNGVALTWLRTQGLRVWTQR